MIVEESRELREQIKEYAQKLWRKNNAEKVNGTYETLKKIGNQLRIIVKQFNTLKVIMTEDELADMANRLSKIRVETEKFSDLFGTESDQARALNSFKKNHKSGLDIYQSRLQGIWEKYLEKEIQSEQEIYRLIRQLPEARMLSNNVDRIFKHLADAKYDVPETETGLDKIEAYIRNLRTEISQVEGLTPAIKEFLQKMANNSATVDDLTGEVLAWCRQGDRSRAFAITFAKGH